MARKQSSNGEKLMSDTKSMIQRDNIKFKLTWYWTKLMCHYVGKEKWMHAEQQKYRPDQKPGTFTK